MELFCAGDVYRPTMFLALALVVAACKLQPISRLTLSIANFAIGPTYFSVANLL